MPTIQTTGTTPVELHYEDHGAGDPVVLIHGWPLSGRSWEPQIPALVDSGHRVITYDRRGFGASTQTWEGYDYDTFAADLDTLLTELDLTNVTLVGFSMGGGEVVRYLARYGSARVARAVLAAAVPPFLAKSDDNPDGALPAEAFEGMQAGVLADRAAFLDEFLTNFFTPAHSKARDLLPGDAMAVSEPQRHYAAQIAAFASPKGTHDCIAAFGTTDFRGDLAKVTVPTLVIHGDSDQIVPFEASGKRAHETLADSRLVVLEGAPHGCNLSHKDEFNDALLTFIRETAPVGAGARS